MRVNVYTVHTLDITPSTGTDDRIEATVDGDNTVRLTWPGADVNSPWMFREELLALRQLINRALDLLP